MKPLLLTFDVEEFDYLHHYHEKPLNADLYGVSKEGTKKIMQLLEKHRVRATFFVTAKFALQYPEIIKELSKKHEIALHGYSHDHHYESMEEKMVFKYLSEAKKILEKITKKKILGFRSPRMGAASYPSLKKIDIKYDSSLHPTYIPGYYNHFTEPRSCFTMDGVKVVPVSVTPIARLPIAWLWFRNLPLLYTKFCMWRALRGTGFINTYFHPCEFVSLKKYKLPWYFKRNTGDKVLRKLEKLIVWAKKKNYMYMSINDFLQSR